MRDIPPHIYRLTFPKWTRGNEVKILIITIICFLGGTGGAFLEFLKHPSAIFVWHSGLFSFMAFLGFHLRGLYIKYLDCAWDVYY